MTELAFLADLSLNQKYCIFYWEEVHDGISAWKALCGTLFTLDLFSIWDTLSDYCGL